MEIKSNTNLFSKSQEVNYNLNSLILKFKIGTSKKRQHLGSTCKDLGITVIKENRRQALAVVTAKIYNCYLENGDKYMEEQIEKIKQGQQKK